MQDAVRRHRDGALAVIALVAALVPGVAVQGEVVPDCGVALVLALAVLVRRRWPLTALTTAQVLGVAVTATHLVAADTAGFVLADLVLGYSVAAGLARRPALLGLGVGLAAFWTEDVLLGHTVGEYAASAFLVTLPWFVGRYVRRERELRLDLRAALAGERDAVARTAVADERQRVARAMHRIVADGLSEIAAQSTAAQAVLISDRVDRHDPALGHEAVREINRVARRCGDEMRALLTVLRGSDEDLPVIAPADVASPAPARFLTQCWAARDYAITAAVLLVGLVSSFGAAHDRAFAAIIAVAVAAPVVVRRRHAIVVLAYECAALVLVTSLHPVPELGVAFAAGVLFVVFPAGMRRDRTSLLALIIALAGFWYGDAIDGHPASGYLASAVTVAGVWSIGAVIGRARELRAQVAAATLAERNALAATAASDERRRLAREMHDVVAHGLSAIAVQSSAADAVYDVDAARALLAVRTVTVLADRCGAEMRHLLDVLGADTAESTFEVGLDEVLGAQEPLGLSVQSDVDRGLLTDRFPGVAQATARIVQEALTNVRRHSQAASARVEIEQVGERVHLTVSDPGPARTRPSPHVGHGTSGIRERVAALAGDCRIGPCDGGWVVHVEFPAPEPTGPAPAMSSEAR